MMFIYIIVNNLLYIKKECQESDLDVHAEKYDIKKDLINYINSDGKVLLIIYGLLAVISELSYLLGINFISTLLVFIFPLASVINIPIIRTIVSYIIMIAFLLLLTEYNRYKEYKTWNKRN